MEFTYTEDEIVFEKELSPLDEFTIAFTQVLDKHKIHYVLMSGYIAILFGRSRSSEDIDMFIDHIPYEKFVSFWNDLHDFECITTSSPKDAYSDYLEDGLAIRFARNKQYVPNMEIKFAKKELDFFTMRGKKKVIVNNHVLWISPIETQIAFKLSLGSDKDIEDARHLTNVFNEHLNRTELADAVRKLQVQELYNRYIHERLNKKHQG